MIYVASPYSHDNAEIRRERYDDASRYVADCIMFRRIPAFSPIVYAHELAERFDLPFDAEAWWKFNKSMLRHANAMHILTLDGWRESKGIREELTFAQNLNISVQHVDMYGRQVL